MPDSLSPWHVLEAEAIQDCRVFRVHRTLARSAAREAEHTFYTIEAPDWVNVIPVTPEGDVILVRQFRHGAGMATLEIPGGMVDPGEAPKRAAARELLEETGYRGLSLRRLGSVNPNPALFGNTCYTYLASDVCEVAPIRNAGAEETVVVRVPRAELPERVRNGEITHALVLAAFHWYGLTGEA